MTASDGDDSAMEHVRHELGNASLLLDAALRLLRDGDPTSDPADAERALDLLDDVKRRLDQLSE